MREIRYRVWNGKEFDHYFINNRQYQVGYNRNFDFQLFTGLKDKNRKEIYEGDIVTDGRLISAVTYGEGAFEGAHGYMGWLVGGGIDESFAQQDAENYEVIGNVYENPELLEEVAA